MADQLGEARLKLSVDSTAYDAGLQRAKQQAQRAGVGIEQSFSKAGGGGLGAAALALGGTATAALAVGAAVAGIGTAAVQSAGQIQRLNAAFTGLTGSAEAARQLRQDLFTLSKTTPFKNEDILTAAQRFLAVGVNAKNLEGTINRVGAIAAQSGQPLERLALIYAQVYAKGRLQGEENLQLLEAGVDLTDELATVTGKSGAALRDAMSKGLISIEDFNKALVLATGDMSSLEQAGKAVDVAFNNIGDNLGQVFGGFTVSIAPALAASFNVINRILEQAFPSLQAIEDAFKPLTIEAERFAKALESNPELIAAIAAGVREWAGLIVNGVANGLRTVNDVLAGIDGKTMVQGFINAELVARRVLLTLQAIGTTTLKNGELLARSVSNPIQFGRDIAASGGVGKFLEKEYSEVRQKWAAITSAQPLQFSVAAAGSTKIAGDLSSKPGTDDARSRGFIDEVRNAQRIAEIRRTSALEAQRIDITSAEYQRRAAVLALDIARERQAIAQAEADQSPDDAKLRAAREAAELTDEAAQKAATAIKEAARYEADARAKSILQLRESNRAIAINSIRPFISGTGAGVLESRTQVEAARDRLREAQRIAARSPQNTDLARAATQARQDLAVASSSFKATLISAFETASREARDLKRSLEDIQLQQLGVRGGNQGVNQFLSGQALADTQRRAFEGLLPLFQRARETQAQRFDFEGNFNASAAIRNLNFTGTLAGVNESISRFIQAVNAETDNANRRQDTELAITRNQNDLALIQSQSALLQPLNSLYGAVNALAGKNWAVIVNVAADGSSTVEQTTPLAFRP